MKTALRFMAIGVALATAACDKGTQQTGPAPADGATSGPAAPAAGQDWTEQVIQTPQGGYLMGNPNAPVKLVEYASLTCPHCADFSATGTAPLKEKYIKTGQVSWEFRNFVLNPLDVAASLLARCQGPGPVFKLTEQVYAEQQSWIAKFTALPQAEAQRLSTLPEKEQFSALAKAGGLDQFFRARGVPSAKIDQCLSDETALKQLVELRRLGSETDRISGTPSFLIDGELQTDVFNWETLDAKLKEKLG